MVTDAPPCACAGVATSSRSTTVATKVPMRAATRRTLRHGGDRLRTVVADIAGHVAGLDVGARWVGEGEHLAAPEQRDDELVELARRGADLVAAGRAHRERHALARREQVLDDLD